MNLQTFFENFDTIAEAPGGIDKLRSLILDLAVRGKLVQQKSEDLASPIFLKKILKEREIWYQQVCKIAKNDGARKPKKPCLSMPNLDSVALPFQIPSQWSFCFFEHLAASKVHAIKAGPFGSALKKSDHTKSGFKVYGQEQVIKGDAFFGEYFIGEEKFEKLKSCFVEPGDLLISLVGTIGKTLTLPEGSKPGIINPRLVKFSLHKDVNRKFIEFYLSSPSSVSMMRENSHGGTINILNLKILSELPIPLPPLAEQNRIVAKVDELMALCDRLQAAQEKRDRDRQKLRASALDALMNAPTDEALDQSWAFVRDHWERMLTNPADISNFKDSFLQLSLRGKLNKEKPHIESAQDLIEKLKITRKDFLRKKLIKKSKSVEPINELDIPYKLPQNWSWVRMGTLIKEIKYGTSKKCSYELKNDIPVLRIPNIDVKNGVIDKADLKFSTLSQKEIEDLGLLEHDLLMIRSNGSKGLVGRSAVVDSTISGYAYAGYLVRLRFLNNSISSRYIHCALNSLFVRRQLELPIRSTSGVKNINTSEISNLLIPLPPHEIQEEIVSQNKQTMLQFDRLETSLRQSQEKASALASAATANLEI